MCENPAILKVTCGGNNDLLRLRKDFHCFALLVIDIQDLFCIWRDSEFSSCFSVCQAALRNRTIQKQKNADVSSQALKLKLQQYDAPALDFLISVFRFPADKKKCYTMSDWTQRPLTKEQIEYAGKDSYYTLAIFYELYILVSIFNVHFS